MKVKMKKCIGSDVVEKLALFYKEVLGCSTSCQIQDGFASCDCIFSSDFIIQFVESELLTSSMEFNIVKGNLSCVENKLREFEVPYEKDEKKRIIITYDPDGNKLCIEQEKLYFSLPKYQLVGD